MKIEQNTIYTLDELINQKNEYSEFLLNKLKDSEFKNTIRHKVINSFKDFSNKDKKLLRLLKSKVFLNNNIYVFGSRISGKYITETEYKKYFKKYKRIKVSDWDIQSLITPPKDSILEFEKEHKVKIDFYVGTNKIKV